MNYFKPAEAHWNVFIDYFEKYPDFATGRILSVNAREKYIKLWEELTNKLNSLGLGEKTVEKWKKTWTDYKCMLKRKAAEIERYRNATGSGPPLGKSLTELERKMLHYLGETFYKGCGTTELGVPKTMERNDPRPSTSGSSKRQYNELTGIINNDHDYLAQPSAAKKKKTENEHYISSMYEKTLEKLDSIDSRLAELNNHVSNMANSLAIIAEAMSNKN